MQFAHLLAVLSLATVARAACDDDLVTANAIPLTQACTDDLQGGTPGTIATVFADYRSNGDTVYKYGLCGSATCKAEITGLSYPTCSPTTETSYTAEIAAFANDCTTLNTAVTGNGGTCTEANIADNIWAKKVVTIDAACATALSKTAGDNWYTDAFTPLDITTTNAITTAYCESSACVAIATSTKAKLTTCTDGTDANKDLFTAIGDVLTYCATPTPAPTTTEAPTPAPTTTEAPTPAPTTTEAPTPAPTTTEAPTPAPTTTEAPTPAPTTTTAAPTTTTTTAAPATTTTTAAPATTTTTAAPATTTTTAAPETTTTTAAPENATTTAAPATTTAAPNTTTAAPTTTTAAPTTTATPTPTPTKSSATTLESAVVVAVLATVMAL